MHEQFHTEDCGISLICRCCRGPVCYRHLSHADRMSIRRELWPSELPRRQDIRLNDRRWTIHCNLAAKMFRQIARWALRTRDSGVVSPSTKA
jgi:hypothetical protein